MSPVAHSSWAGAAEGWIPGPFAPWCTSGPPPSWVHRRSPRTDCGTPQPPTSWRAVRTCALCRNCSATPAWRQRRSTPTFRPNGWLLCTDRRTHGPDSGAPDLRRCPGHTIVALDEQIGLCQSNSCVGLYQFAHDCPSRRQVGRLTAEGARALGLIADLRSGQHTTTNRSRLIGLDIGG